MARKIVIGLAVIVLALLTFAVVRLDHPVSWIILGGLGIGIVVAVPVSLLVLLFAVARSIYLSGAAGRGADMGPGNETNPLA